MEPQQNVEGQRLPSTGLEPVEMIGEPVSFECVEGSVNSERDDLVLEGSLTIKTIADVKDAICNHMKKTAEQSGALVIEIRGDDFDLTLPQLLLSARKTAKENSRELKLKRPAEGKLLDVLQRAGLLTGNPEYDSFWLNGEAA